MGLFGICDGRDDVLAAPDYIGVLCRHRGRKEIAQAAFDRINSLVTDVPFPVGWLVRDKFIRGTIHRLCDHHADVLVSNAGEVARSRCPYHPDEPYMPDHGPWVPLSELPRDSLHCISCTTDRFCPYYQRAAEQKRAARKSAEAARARIADAEDGIAEATEHQAWLRYMAEGGEL